MYLMNARDLPDRSDEPPHTIRVDTCALCGDAITLGETEYIVNDETICNYCARHEPLINFEGIINFMPIRAERG